MRLDEIFRKRRKTEPKAIIMCRNVIVIVIIALLIGYTIYLILNICNDVPVLRTESKMENSLRFPAITLAFKYQFNIACVVVYINGTSSRDCINYVSQPTFNSSVNMYLGLFNPPPNLKAEGLNHPSGLYSIVLTFTVVDQAYNSSSPRMSVIETVIEYADNSYEQLLRTVNKTDPGLVNSIAASSVHALFNRQFYMLSYTQSERHIMKKSSLSAFGISSGVLRVPYITSTLEGGVMPDSVFDFSIMAIIPQTFVVKVEVEQRSNTVLSAFGLLGGVWSITAGLYAFLLGKETIRPWGCVQSYCCCFIRPTRSKLYKSFPVVPFQSSEKLPESESSSQSEETIKLKKRVDTLELFIQEYIADTGYLDGLKEGECPNRISAWLSRFNLKNRRNQASRNGNGNEANKLNTRIMSQTPTQTRYYSKSWPIPPTPIQVYSTSAHSDSHHSYQPDTYGSDLPVRQAFQDQLQPAAQQGYPRYGSRPVSDFDLNPTSVGTVTDVRSNQLLYTAQPLYTSQER